ncbi:multicopper oxidase domain-containing protein [Micromonospora sp. CA-259024]|uniref:multicopper oxidase domain-containing protein n=1 Tax=Micromonospora sp. CA-259024 TaxID=3239965 RepID=UPI003D8DDBC9
MRLAATGHLRRDGRVVDLQHAPDDATPCTCTATASASCPGQTYEITGTADNPGIWMDHCHNGGHAADGMVWQLSHAGIAATAHSTHRPE